MRVKLWSCLLMTAALLVGYAPANPLASIPAKASAGASVTLSPATAGASGVTWTVRLLVPYCGGYKIGRYVLLRFEPPFALPAKVPPAAVSFADGPAVVTREGNTLRIAPAPGRMWSMACGPVDSAGNLLPQPLSIVLSAAAGLANPPEAGTYSIQVSTDADPHPIVVVVRSTPP